MHNYFQSGILLVLSVAVGTGGLLFVFNSVRGWKHPATIGLMIGVLHFVVVPFIYLGIYGEIPIQAIHESVGIDAVEIHRDFWPVLVALTASTLLAVLVYFAESVTAYSFNRIAPSHAGNEISAVTLLTRPASSEVSALCIAAVIYVVVCYFSITLSGVAAEGGHWYRSREHFMQESGFKAVLLISLHVGALITYLLTSYRVAISRPSPVLRLVLLVLPVCLLDTVLRGNRIVFVWAGLLIALTCVQRRALTWLFIITMVAIPAGWFLALYRVIRGRILTVRSIDDLVSLVETGIREDSDSPSSVLLACESQDLICLVAMIRKTWVLSSEQFALNRATFLKPFLVFVPYSVLPDKPRTISLVVAKEVFNVPTSWPPLLTGEAIINLWYFGIPVAAALVVFVAKLPCWIAIRDRNTAFAATILFSYSAFRFPFDVNLQYTVLTLVPFVLIDQLSRRVSIFVRS